MTGTTISPWARGGGGGDGDEPGAGRGRGGAGRGGANRGVLGPGGPLEGIPGLFKGPVGRITAIDLNTGEHLWMIPYGDMATEQQEAFRNNPLLKGVKVDTNWGRNGHAAMMATSTLLFSSGSSADSRAHLFAIDKKTGKRVGQVATPEMAGYGLMTYMHAGKQYVVLPVNGGYTALALP
jgi:quinoprotein glucose dehydrogenase